MHRRSKELLVFYILPIVAVVLSLALQAEYLMTILLFWGFPALFLSFLAKKHVKKALLFAAIGTPFLMSLDLIFYFTQSWYVFTDTYRLLGIIAWEDILYFFFWVYFPVLFWEHFYDSNKKDPLWRKRMRFLVYLFVFSTLMISFSWLFAPHLLLIPYFYLCSTIVLILLPLLFESIFNPKLAFKFLGVGLHFAFSGILYELTALHLGLFTRVVPQS